MHIKVLGEDQNFLCKCPINLFSGIFFLFLKELSQTEVSPNTHFCCTFLKKKQKKTWFYLMLYTNHLKKIKQKHHKIETKVDQ